MPMMMVENAEDFVARHGGKGRMVRLSPSNWLFHDGARLSRSERDTAAGVVFTEPPTVPLERLRAIETYHKTRLANLEKAFGKMKNALLGGNTYDWEIDLLGPPIGNRSEFDGTKQALLRVRELVLAQRQDVAAIEAEIEQLPEIRARREDAERRRLQDEESRRRAIDRRNEIEAITID